MNAIRHMLGRVFVFVFVWVCECEYVVAKMINDRKSPPNNPNYTYGVNNMVLSADRPIVFGRQPYDDEFGKCAVRWSSLVVRHQRIHISPLDHRWLNIEYDIVEYARIR